MLFKRQIQGCIAKTSPGCSVAIFALRCVVSGAFGSLGGPCGNPLGAVGSPVRSVCLASLPRRGALGTLWGSLFEKTLRMHVFLLFLVIPWVPPGLPPELRRRRCRVRLVKTIVKVTSGASKGSKKGINIRFFVFFANSSRRSAVGAASIYVSIAALVKLRF